MSKMLALSEPRVKLIWFGAELDLLTAQNSNPNYLSREQETVRCLKLPLGVLN